jgi:hypothetical protein
MARLRIAQQLTLFCASVAHAGGPIATRATADVAAYSDTGQVASPTQGWSISGSYLADVISAASVDIISTASQQWSEVRQAGTLDAAYKPKTLGAAVTSSISSEPDYLAYAVGGTVTADFDERNLSVLLGYGYGHDTIGRTGTPFSVFSHTLEHSSITGAITRVVDRSTTLTVVGDVRIEDGDPSKPYRYIPMFTADVAPSVPVGASLQTVTALRTSYRPLEQLPLSRDRFSLTARLARRLGHSTVRLESRAYADTWSILGFTADARYLLDLRRATPACAGCRDRRRSSCRSRRGGRRRSTLRG